MARLPRVSAKQMTAALERLGFRHVRQSGSHAIYKNPEGLRATIPMHGATILHPKTIKTIMRDTNLSVAELKTLF